MMEDGHLETCDAKHSMKDFLAVKRDGVGVFGYKADVLHSITNESPRAVAFTLATAKDTMHHITLQTGETRDLDIDIWECVRNRFMPYVETEEDLLLSIAWQSQGVGSSLPHVQTHNGGSTV